LKCDWFYEKSLNVGNKTKVSKYMPDKNIVRSKNENKLSKGCHTRIVNSSISNSHKVDSSKSKLREKTVHKKCQNNIPVYQNFKTSGKGMAKKQFSNSMRKK
jgi:hypothetical protein